jgi:hypothetical protein
VGADIGRVAALRRELTFAERELRATADKEATRLAEAERCAWREARDACHDFDRIRPLAQKRLAASCSSADERFTGERGLAEMSLHDADLADASYTVISFAQLRDRLRYLHGGAERQSVVREAFTRGGVYTERGYFQEILK